MTVRGVVSVWALLVGLAAASAQAPAGFDVPLDLKGMRIQGNAIVDAAGREQWRISTFEGRGAKVSLDADGDLAFAGHVFSDAAASLARKGIPSHDYVFETRFVLSPPAFFYGSLLFIMPRVSDAAAGKGYRIAYSFVSPCKVAANSTGFFLWNTADEAYQKNPHIAPIAGARYRLVYGREYTAYTAIRDTPEGVTIQFTLDDPTVPGDEQRPLFSYTDTSPNRLPANGDACVAVGSGSLNVPASPVCFRGMRIYSPDRLAERLSRPRDTTAFPALAAPAVPSLTEIPNVFSDNMVLQQRRRIPVWGKGIEGDEITVTLAGSSARAGVANGRWKVELDPVPAGGPYVLTVKGRDRTLEVKNVLVGEVWVLGGQSNMCWGLESTTEAAEEVPKSDFPQIRIFDGWHPAADTPQFNLWGGRWKIISPALQGRFSAVGYYFAKELHQRLKVPIGLIQTSTPATGIETWMSGKTAEAVYGRALTETPGVFPRAMMDPSVFYNGKVAPVMPYAVAGFLWYQGDGSSPETGFRYRGYIPALIRDWREGFGQGDLPFLVVQIPRFQGCSPEMRESDLLSVLGAKNAGLAVTLDCGEPENIHPRNKRPVGERLSLIARALAYGEKIEYMGPIYRGMEIQDGKAILSFDHTGSGLELRGSGGWEICGADGRYVKADAALEGDRVVVSSPGVAQPTAVRYAWATVPEFSLFNEEGLLATPFRTRVEEPR